MTLFARSRRKRCAPHGAGFTTPEGRRRSTASGDSSAGDAREDSRRAERLSRHPKGGALLNEVVAASLIIGGVIHLMPAAGVLGRSALTRLYAVEIDDPDLEILLRHRSVLFALLGAFLVLAAFAPELRTAAFIISLPTGARLVPDGSGAKVVDARGETIGRFLSPWAKDSAGHSVPTHYKVSGDHLTQFVDHRSRGVSYPVVADPTYVNFTSYYSRSDVESIYKAVNNVNNVCRLLPLPYLYSLGCGASASLSDAVTQAHYQKKRVKAVYHDCGYTYCNYYTYSVVT
jgi:hypothetical protein